MTDKTGDLPKHFYADSSVFSKTNNPCPDEFLNKIITADSLETLKKLPDNSIDFILTSPPYNFEKDYSDHNDKQSWDDYFNTIFAIFDECMRVLKYSGRIAINVMPRYVYYVPLHHIISDYFRNKNMIWRSEVIWEKHNYKTPLSGIPNSPTDPFCKSTWEFIEVFSKGDLVKEGSELDNDMTRGEYHEWNVARWDIRPEFKMKLFEHPAMFPEELARRLIKMFSFRGDIVLDPFNGAGTTSLVASKHGRKYIGIDISEKYNETARQRIEEADEKRKFIKQLVPEYLLNIINGYTADIGISKESMSKIYKKEMQRQAGQLNTLFSALEKKNETKKRKRSKEALVPEEIAYLKDVKCFTNNQLAVYFEMNTTKIINLYNAAQKRRPVKQNTTQTIV